MRLSTTVNFLLPPYNQSLQSGIDALRRYRALGFSSLDSIFCGAAAPDSFFRDQDWEMRIHGLADAANEIGITFVQSHIPTPNPYLTPASAMDDTNAMIHRSISAASILGAPWTVGHPFTALGHPTPMLHSKKINIDYFRRILEVCEKNHIGLALENMADFEGGGRSRWYCAHVEELCELIDILDEGTGLVGACWDFGHANLVYADQTECLRMLGHRLKVTHVHDNSGQRDDHLSPFRGNVNWFDIMRTLAETGYAHDFSFEVRRIIDPEIPEEIKDSLWRHVHNVGEYLISLYEAAKS